MSDQITSLPNTTGARRQHEAIPVSGDDWVLAGVELIADWDASELKVTSGELLLADSGTLYWSKVRERTGLTIPAGTTDVYYVIDTSGTPTGSYQLGGSPTQPYLTVGSTDASAQTTSTANRNGSRTFESTSTERVFFGTLSSAPSDSEYESGQVALYFKTDDNLYKRPHGGTESQVGGGGSGETTRTENTLADAGKAQLLDVAQTAAKVTVIDETNDELSEWFLRGTNNDAQLLFDSNSHFTNVEDNDTTVNIYWDATNTQYEVNNETGGQITVAAIDVRET